MKKILMFCKKYMKQYRRYLYLYFFFCITLSFLSLAIPYISGNYIDYLVSGKNVSDLQQYCMLYIIIAAFSIVMGYMNNKLYISLQTRMGFQLNRDVISHIQHLPLSYIEKHDTAYLNQQISADANSLTTFCINILQNVVINLITILLSFIVVFCFSPTISISIFILIPSYFLVYRFLKKILFSRSYDFKESQSAFFSKLYEQLAYIKQLKLNAICTEFIFRLNTAFDKLFHCTHRYQNISYAFTGLDSFILAIAHVFLFLYGGYQVIIENLTVGQFTIISTYFGIMINSTRFFSL